MSINSQTEKKEVNLFSFQNNDFDRGASLVKELLWMLTSFIFFKHGLSTSSEMKVSILKLFGSTIGKGVIIKPNVNIKFPWKLIIGNHCWIGEQVWIDNLAIVKIEDHVCVSQGAMLLCGNHDYTTTSFDLITKEIYIKQGAWIGAKSIVCPGVTVGTHAVLSVGSVATRNLEDYGIYQGVPAEKTRIRVLK